MQQIYKRTPLPKCDFVLQHGCSPVNLQHITSNPLLVTGKLKVTRLYFLKEIVLAHFQRLFGRSNCYVFLENKGKIHEGGCVKEFFTLTYRLASPNFIID